MLVRKWLALVHLWLEKVLGKLLRLVAKQQEVLVQVELVHTGFPPFVCTNSTCTNTSCCFATSLNNFPNTFSYHGCTSTSHFRTSICAHRSEQRRVRH